MSTQKPQSSSAWDVLLALIQKVNVQIFLFALGFGILLIIGLITTPRVDQVFTKVIWALLAVYVVAVVAYLYSRMTKRPANSEAEIMTLIQKPSSAPTQLLPNILSSAIYNTQEQLEIQLIREMIQSGVLATSEKHSRGAVQQLDNKPPGYWTNFDLDFEILNANRALMDRLIQIVVRHYLAGVKEVVLTKPHHFKAPAFTVETLETVSIQLKLRLVDSLPPDDGRSRLIVVAGIFSPDLREFALKWAQHIELLIVLLGPDLEYLTTSLGLPPNRIRCLVCAKHLMQIDPNVRSQMIGGH